MLDWILVRHQADFTESVAEMVLACYTDKKPARWRQTLDWPPPGVEPDLWFLEGVPPAPTVPNGYAIEDFVRISNIYLIQRALVFGVSVKVAWAEEEIGLRYEANPRAAADEREAYLCIVVGPQDVAFC